MATCIECSAELAPKWKFCILCGAPVEQTVARSESDTIPGAIRPEPSIVIGTRALSPAQLFGWSLGVILVVIVVVGVIVVLVR
jgi:hypothetical protein